MAPAAQPALKPGNEKEPSPERRVLITYRPENSIVHYVSDGERWESVAAQYGIDVKELILANFKTLDPTEVNWYLHHYVACDTPTEDRYNWRFSTSSRKGKSPRAGIIYVPMKQAAAQPQAPAPSSNGADQLARDLEEMQATLKEIQESIRSGQRSLNELMCTIATEQFRRRGIRTNQSLRYLGADIQLLLAFLECMILSSRRIGPFVQGHPNASHSNPSSPIGDIATLSVHSEYNFQGALANEGIQVDANTRGLFDPGTRRIHLPDTATFGQALHEGIHTFSSRRREQPAFLVIFGSFLYEGATQLFTDWVLDDQQWDRAIRHDYADEVGCATRLVADFGQGPVGNAYFRQQVAPLANAVARRLGITLVELQRLARRRDNNRRRAGHVLCENLGYI